MFIFFKTFFPLLLYLDNVLHIICKYESNTHFVLVCNPSFVCSVYCGFFSRQCAFAWRTQWTEPFIPFTTIYQFLPRFFFSTDVKNQYSATINHFCSFYLTEQNRFHVSLWMPIAAHSPSHVYLSLSQTNSAPSTYTQQQHTKSMQSTSKPYF